MKRLATLDYQDYPSSWPVHQRISARCIVVNNGKVLMNYIGTGEYYSFPGGGVEHGESLKAAAYREVIEETGYTVLVPSMREFGEILVKKSNEKFDGSHTIFEGLSVYFTAKLDPIVSHVSNELTDDEKLRDFKTVFITPREAYINNTQALIRSRKWTDPLKLREVEFINREQAVLGILLKHIV